MDVHGRLFLISTFVASVGLCVGSKLAGMTFERDFGRSFDRFFSEGCVLALHFVYMGSAREGRLAKPNESYQLVLDSLGSSVTSIYAHLQFLVSVIGNHYMSICASDIVLEYLTILLQQQNMVPLDHAWRTYFALFGNVTLTVLNCHSIHWTTATFAVYMKSLFMSFWMAKIYFNLDQIQATIAANQQSFLLLCSLTSILLIILISTKEFACFPHDIVSANQTVLIPLFERLAAIYTPELPIIAACYGASSLNNFFVGRDPLIKAAQSGQLPFSLSLTSPSTNSPVVLLTIRTLITAGAALYLNLYDLPLLSACWDLLLLTSAIFFDIALLHARLIDLNCQFTNCQPVLPTSLLHFSFQLASIGFIYHRVTNLPEVGAILLFTGALSIVTFKVIQSEPVVELCCNRLRLQCSDDANRSPPVKPTKDGPEQSLV